MEWQCTGFTSSFTPELALTPSKELHPSRIREGSLTPDSYAAQSMHQRPPGTRWRIPRWESEVIQVRNGCERDSRWCGVTRRVNPAEVHRILPIPAIQLIGDHANLHYS